MDFLFGAIFAIIAVAFIVHFFFSLSDKKLEKYEVIFKRILSLDEKDTSYKSFSIPKKDWTTRIIDAPNSYLKAVQQLVLENLQNSIILPSYVTWFRKKMSIKTNAKKHIWKKIVINLDIKDFFSNVTVEKLRTRLAYFNIPQEVVDRIEKLCFYNGRLPQWAPTSPFLANFIFLPVDMAIISILNYYDVNVWYSRYADNITISSDVTGITNAIRIIEQWLLSKCGFELNKVKTNVARAHSRQTVTWIVVNQKLSYPRKKYMLLRAKVHTFLAKWTGDVRVIAGHLAFLRMIDKGKYETLKKYYKKKFPIAANFLSIFPNKSVKKWTKWMKEVPPSEAYLNDVGVTGTDLNNPNNNS